MVLFTVTYISCIERFLSVAFRCTIGEVIAASGQKNLEDAYLFFMGEEELL